MILILEDREVELAPGPGGKWRGVYSSVLLETLAGMAVYIHADTESWQQLMTNYQHVS